MSSTAATEIRRLDYRPFPYKVPTVALSVRLLPEYAEVESTITVQRASMDGTPADLELDADWKCLQLTGVRVGGEALEEGSGFRCEEGKLVVDGAALAARAGEDGSVEVATSNRQKPQENLAFEGLYLTGGAFMTQMEADGFRRFAPHPDRPDVMSRYTCRISAPEKDFPVLLSNGNCVESGSEEGGRHWVRYSDPWPKPSYLFALVAGRFDHVESRFRTCEGRDVRLRVYAAAQVDKCTFALESLERAMKWDEETFGRAYDLDEFNVVVAADFNMGAMENKSLNIFNTKFVLADPSSATDTDLEMVEGVVAHEYFHNWSGNRVTCRDWFSLTLKEGLTVFRDGEFTADMASRAMKRVRDASFLRSRQFAEDGSAMSHSIRPDAVAAMNNLYSLTVYEKGAEVVRMYRTLLGSAQFRRGTNHYFSSFDGQAVTCDHFATAMEEANWEALPAPDAASEGQEPGEGEDAFVDLPFARAGPRPLTQFRRWYAVGGTPEVQATGSYDADAGTYTLRLRQHVPDTATQKGPKPALHIPVACALLGRDGSELPATLRHSDDDWAALWGAAMVPTAADAAVAGPDLPAGAPGQVLHLTEADHTFVFEGVEQRPVPSLLRGFSAPVRLSLDGDCLEDRLFRVAHDADAFCRWDAADRVATDLVLARVPAAAGAAADGDAGSERAFFDACAALLAGATAAEPRVDPALVGEILSLPDVESACEAVKGRDKAVDPAAVAAARGAMRVGLATHCAGQLGQALESVDAVLAGRSYEYTPRDTALRALRNQVLALLADAEAGGAPVPGVDVAGTALALVKGATNMTDQMGALAAVARLPAATPARGEALAWFYDAWKDDTLVLDKWFAVQARFGSADDVEALMQHPAFNRRNPNKIYSLIRTFAAANHAAFHDASGRGYRLVADFVGDLDADNPGVSSRVAGTFAGASSWAGPLRTAAKDSIQRMLAPGEGREASKDMGEILHRTMRAIEEAEASA